MTLEQRLLAKVEQTASGCWLWTDHTDRDGYGRIQFEGKSHGAHRVAHELFVGPIQDGLEIDHLCRNRGCINPAHLEAVTHRENTLRGQRIPAAHLAKSHCANGHPFDAKNTRVLANGWRRCRSCAAASARAYRARQLEHSA